MSIEGLGERRLRLGLLAVALAATTAGCTTGREPRQADVALPAAFEASGDQAYTPQVLDRWWIFYADAQLTGLIDQALAASPTIELAAARLEEARAIRQGALTRFNLQGEIQGNAAYQRTENLDDDGGSGAFPGVVSPTGDSRSASLSFPVSWELDLFGRRAAARRSADADLAAARFLYEGTRTQLASDTAQSLFQARGLAIQLDDAEQTVRIRRELVRVVRRRVDVGLSAASDVAVVEADLRSAESEAARLEAELRASKRSLLVLVGRATEPTEALVLAPLAEATPASPQVVPGQLIARRPDVREAEARLRSAAGALTSAELEFFPRINLLPGAGLSYSEQAGFESSTGFWSLAAGLAVPVLDRPRLQSALRAQTARTEQAVIGYERAVQGAFSEAEQTLTLLNADRNRVVLLEAAESRARTAYDAAQRRYRAGLEALQPVLDAERIWRGSRSALAAARVQALLRSVQAFKAVGGGWTPEAAVETVGS